MTKLARALCAFATVLGLLLPCQARADLPPPPGQARVHYSVRVTGALQGVVLVAYPTYVPEGGSVGPVTQGKDLVFFQGYTPGIYSLPAEDAASLAGKAGDEVEKVLASKGHTCVRKVPRVFTVLADTKITSMIDVLQIDATLDSCRASLAKTIYGGANGEQGEGGLDSSGHRAPPAPFTGEDLPVVADLVGPAALPSAPATAAPPSVPTTESPRGGCAGCATPAPTETGEGALAILALLAIAVRRRASRGEAHERGMADR
jgi:hypothetical protein